MKTIKRLVFLFLLLFVPFLFAATPAAAQCAPLMGIGAVQFEDNSGAPLVNGAIYVYVGGTTTQAPSYQDSQCSVLNTNPVTFTTGGRATIWVGTGFFKLVLCAVSTDGPFCSGSDILFSIDQIPGASAANGGGSSPFIGTFISGTASPSTSGVLRLASGDSGPCWRNQAGSANLCISKDSTDIISFPSPIKMPAVGAPSGAAGFGHLWFDNSANRWKQINNGGTAAQVVASGNDVDVTDAVKQVHFGASAAPFSSTLPSTNQFLQWNGSQIVGANSVTLLTGYCFGAATSSSTLGLAGLGGLGTACNSSSTLAVWMSEARTVQNLRVLANLGGVNASSGAVTVNKNGVATGITCTIGTGTSCTDLTHTASVVAGDKISVTFTTQASETLASLQVTLEVQ